MPLALAVVNMVLISSSASVESSSHALHWNASSEPSRRLATMSIPVSISPYQSCQRFTSVNSEPYSGSFLRNLTISRSNSRPRLAVFTVRSAFSEFLRMRARAVSNELVSVFCESASTTVCCVGGGGAIFCVNLKSPRGYPTMSIGKYRNAPFIQQQVF